MKETKNSVGQDMYDLAKELYPICRSITGNGVRETLAVVNKHIPLDISEVPTGTKVFDWVVPKEWNIKDAYIKDKSGNKIVDFKENNLHVVGYSQAVNDRLSLQELTPHLHTLPGKPDWVPYRTSYYDESWGFCLSHKQYLSLADDTYDVVIDSELSEGSLTLSEYVIPGETDREVLFSTHICHPSLANDNLSGIALLTYLAKELSVISTRYTYRFLFVPGTIGSISWLSLNENKAKNIDHGLVISCVGDEGGPTYKRSRRGNAPIDVAMEHVLRNSHLNGELEDFSPYGYDERQYCSPGFNLPVGLFERSKYGEYSEYHTSADDLSLISPQNLGESFQLVRSAIDILENNRKYLNLNGKCEPQLGRRGLYSAIGGDNEKANKQLAMLWILNQSDGNNSLLDIAVKANLSFSLVHETAVLLEEKGLIEEIEE